MIRWLSVIALYALPGSYVSAETPNVASSSAAYAMESTLTIAGAGAETQASGAHG